MVNDIIEELLDLDMEPKPELLTSTYNHEDMRTLHVGGSDRSWDLPFFEVFDVCLGFVFIEMGRGFKAPSAGCARP